MQIDWDLIYQLKWIDQPGCWTTCNGYCCKTESKFLSFNFFKAGTAGMVFLDDEYEYLKENGKLQKGFLETTKRMSFKIDEEITLKFVVAKCALGGICSIAEFRPIICKAYPFLPRIDLKKKEVVGFFNVSVFDQFWSKLKIPHPCTLVREKADEVQSQMRPAIEVIMKYPKLCFYIRAMEIFLDAVYEGFSQFCDKNQSLEHFAKLKKWEFDYFQGLAFDQVKIKKEIRKSYDILRMAHPSIALV